MTLLAGASRVEITPEPGCALMGYGARIGTSSRVHDPLHARALAISHSTSPEIGILLVSAELCLMAPDQALALREQIADGLPISSDQVLVACTHTHSGPETGLAEFLAGQPLPAHVAGIFEGIVAAGRAAWEAREPATLDWHFGEARIGRNRRLEDGPLDPEVTTLCARASDGRVIAIAFRHACHGTVLGHDNLEISADWAGVTSRELEARYGGSALFMLGAHADIDPRTRGLMDLAIDGQSRGLGHDAVFALGSEVAAVITDTLERDRGESVDSVGGKARCIELPVHLGHLEPEAARALLTRRKSELAEEMGIAVSDFPRMSRIHEHMISALRGQPVDEVRERLGRVRMYVRDKTAPFFVGNRRALDVEVQVLRIGGVALLCLPVEPTTNVGFDWHARAAPRTHGAVVGIANGWLRYLPHPIDLAHPLAHRHYEVFSSTLADGACEALLGVAEELLASLEVRSD